MSEASMTNLQMMRPKGPKIFLGILGAVVIAGAAWWLTRPPGPIGEPEDPRRILVVGDDPDVATTLTELGFVAEHGTFEDLVSEASGKVEGTDGDIDAILRLADLKGIGYVALQDPVSHDFAGLTVTADSAEVSDAHSWVVFTTGELGYPPTATVDPNPTELPLPGYAEILRAAFLQERLASTLHTESQLPIDAVELHGFIKPAIDLHAAYALLDRKVRKQVSEREERLVQEDASGRVAEILAAPLELSEAVPLADGTVLSLTRSPRLESPRDPDVRLELRPELALWSHPPGAPSLGSRVRCDSLRGGSLPARGLPRALSDRGDALLLGSPGGAELWTLDVAAKACKFTRQGSFELSDGFGGWPSEVHASGKLLQTQSRLDAKQVAVWTLGEEQPVAITMPGCTRLGDPVWIDEGHFAIACAFDPPEPDDDYDDAYDSPYDDPYDDDTDEEDDADVADGDETDEALEPEPPPPPPAQSWIYVVRLSDQKIAALPGTALDDEFTGAYGLIVTSRGQAGLELLAIEPWDRTVHRVRLGADLKTTFTLVNQTLAELAEAEAAKALAEALAAEEAARAAKAAVKAGKAPPEPEAPRPEEAPPEPEGPRLRPAFVEAGAPIVAIDPTTLEVSTLELAIDARRLTASPSGRHLAYLSGDGREGRGHQIHLMSLDTGKSRVMVDTPRADHTLPRFTADGAALVFTSYYYGDEHIDRVGRYLPLGDGG